jgi:hypothetical protein
MEEIVLNVPINSELVLNEESAVDKAQRTATKNKPLLTHLSPYYDASHKENLFNDFDVESLALHMLSTEGPKLLTGDIDGNGAVDMVLLGAAGDPDKLIVQNDRNKLILSDQPAIASDSIFESTCGLLYDLDGDGDQDLIIGSGGNDISKGIDALKLRSYINDGQGRFEKNNIITLPVIGNLSCISPIQLGSQRALFFGAQAVPGNYGLTPRNFLLLEQTKGFWRDITPQELGQLGMVTDAQTTDIDNDGDDDLVIVGEWMPIAIFENDGNRLVFKENVPNSSGLWQSISAADIDNDGDIDFILGNWGTNSKLSASQSKPLSMFVNDFDKNGKSENIMLWYAPEDDAPALFAAKRDLTGQLPSLKKKILKNKDYSDITFEELFDRETINQSLRLQVTELRSSKLINKGNFNLELGPLPKEAQRSVVFASHLIDVNNDNILDLVIGGNMYGLKPEIGRMDSSYGLVLIGDGTGVFKALNKEQSGLYSKGEIRDIKQIPSKNGVNILAIARNNSELDLYKIND